MSALLIAAALAQVGTTGNSTTPASTDATAPKLHEGQNTYVDLEAGAGYSSNPNLAVINPEGGAFGRVSLHAVHSRVSTLSTLLLSAYAEDQTYTSGVGSQQAVNVAGRYDTAVSEHARLFIDANASYQEGGQLGTRILNVPNVPPLIPGTLEPPILIPPTGDFLSITGRSYSFGGNTGATFSLSPRDNLSLSAGVQHVVFHSGIARTSYTTIPASLAFDRQVNERTSIGARVTYADTQYDGPAGFRSIAPQLTARTLLSPNVSLNGALGVSFSRINDGLTIRHRTGVAGNVSLCGQGENNYYCARVAVDEQTATTAGPARSISGGVDYTQRLDADQSLSFSLGATRYSSPVSVVTGRSFSDSTYYRGAASYSRRFATRMFGGVNLAARKVTQIGPDPRTDFSASLFIRYRFGDIE